MDTQRIMLFYEKSHPMILVSSNSRKLGLRKHERFKIVCGM